MDNMTIFDFMYPTFKINKPIRLIELFGGVGSQAMALRNIGADFEHYKLVEYDKYPVMSYNAIHGTNFEPTDIRNIHGEDLGIVEIDKYCYIMTYSFPCQDLSVAGKMKGMTKGSGTRSGLLWEVERLLSETDNLPQVLLMENVPQVIADANIADFRLWQDFLEIKGYTNYVEVINAKDQGAAQNRERCFMVSILGQWNYKFPQPVPLKRTMADYLEDEVDEKYYIDSEKANQLINDLINKDTLMIDISQYKREGHPREYNDIAPTLTARDWKDPRLIQVGMLDIKGDEQIRRVYSEEGLSPALNTMQGGSRQPKVLVEGNTNPSGNGINGNVFNINGLAPTLTTNKGEGNKIIKPVIVASRGRNPQSPSDRTAGNYVEQRLEPNSEGVCNTLTSVQKDNLVLEPQVKCFNTKDENGTQPHQQDRVYDVTGIMTTISAELSGRFNIMEPQIKIVNIPQTVFIRKYEVDTEKLKFILKEHKKYSNKEIATALNKPTTMVEHWFRNDDCFSIPDADVWPNLKNLLNITTEEFDKSITEFIEQDGVFEKANRCYMADGIAPTLTSTSADEKIIEASYRIRKLTPLECWRLMGFTDEDFHKAEKVNSNTQLYKQAGNSIVVNVLEAIFKQLF